MLETLTNMSRVSGTVLRMIWTRLLLSSLRGAPVILQKALAGIEGRVGSISSSLCDAHT
jgi:hypothetical protein